MTKSPDSGDDGGTERGTDEDFSTCAHCGAVLPDDEWCPVVTERDDDGRLQFRSFCDDSCKDAWVARHQPESTGDGA